MLSRTGSLEFPSDLAGESGPPPLVPEAIGQIIIPHFAAKRGYDQSALEIARRQNIADDAADEVARRKRLDDAVRAAEDARQAQQQENQ